MIIRFQDKFKRHSETDVLEEENKEEEKKRILEIYNSFYLHLEKCGGNNTGLKIFHSIKHFSGKLNSLLPNNAGNNSKNTPKSIEYISLYHPEFEKLMPKKESKLEGFVGMDNFLYFYGREYFGDIEFPYHLLISLYQGKIADILKLYSEISVNKFGKSNLIVADDVYYYRDKLGKIIPFADATVLKL